MKNILYFAFCVFIVEMSCAQSNRETIEISPANFIDQEVMLSSIADDIMYIPLKSEVLIADIGSVKISDNLIIVAGIRGTGILEFKLDGSFNRKIGSRGKGPGEYQYGHHIALDNKAQKIYILDVDKILVYNFNGKLVHTFTNSKFQNFSRIHFNENKLYLFGSVNNSIYNNPYFWMITDTLGNVQFSKENSLTGFKASSTISAFKGNKSYEFNNKPHYWNHYSDTLFELQDISYRAKYLFKNERNRLTPGNSANTEKIENSNYYILEDINECKHYLFISYRQFGKGQLCVYDKNAKVFKRMTFDRGEPKGLKNDIDSGLTFAPGEIIYYKNEECLIRWIFPYELKAHVASKAFKTSTPKYPEKKRELEKLANSLSDNDNPVLMLVKLKE